MMNRVPDFQVQGDNLSMIVVHDQRSSRLDGVAIRSPGEWGVSFTQLPLRSCRERCASARRDGARIHFRVWVSSFGFRVEGFRGRGTRAVWMSVAAFSPEVSEGGLTPPRAARSRRTCFPPIEPSKLRSYRV